MLLGTALEAMLQGAFAGVSLFGLVGLLLGPLAISCFFELVQIYEREYGNSAAQPAQDRSW